MTKPSAIPASDARVACRTAAQVGASAVLALAFLFEGMSWWIALRSFSRAKGAEDDFRNGQGAFSRHTRKIDEFGGLAINMPRYFGVFLVMTLASIAFCSEALENRLAPMLAAGDQRHDDSGSLTFDSQAMTLARRLRRIREDLELDLDVHALALGFRLLERITELESALNRAQVAQLQDRE